MNRMNRNKLFSPALTVGAALLGALAAMAVPCGVLCQEKEAALTKAEAQTLVSLKQALMRDSSKCAAQAEALLANDATTNPAMRRKLATIQEVIRASKGSSGDLGARLEAIYQDAGCDKLILIDLAPRVVHPGHLNADGLRAIQGLEQLATKDGLMLWPIPYIRTKAQIHLRVGDCEKAVTELERIREFQSPKEAGRFGSDVTLPKQDKDILLRKATAGQLERLAAVYEAWAALLEEGKGQLAETYAASAGLRADAKQARRIAEIKSAAAQANK